MKNPYREEFKIRSNIRPMRTFPYTPRISYSPNVNAVDVFVISCIIFVAMLSVYLIVGDL